MIEKMKVVHIVTTAAEKTALLDRLQQLGIVHFSEKASADQQHLQRFADLSRMVTVLQEYGNVPPEKVPLSNDEFEVFFSELSACMERKKALQEEQTAAHAAAERLAEWGRFSPTDLRSLKDAGWDIHIYRTDKKTMAALLNAPDVQIIRLSPVGKMQTFATLSPLPGEYSATEFPIPDKGLEELEQELQASAEANIKGDTAAIITHDTRFHELIIDAADNEYIAEISHMLVLHIQRIRYHFFHLPTMRRISASQHRGILDALRERDAQRAKTLMREHWLTSMNGSLKDTMESLRQAKASGPDETES